MRDDEEDVLIRFQAVREELEKELALLNQQIEELKRRRNEIHKSLMVPPVIPYAGPTGQKAEPDPEFVAEIILRRSALRVSAKKLSLAAGISGGYISMIENGQRFASDEAKEKIRGALTRMEEGERDAVHQDHGGTERR